MVGLEVVAEHVEEPFGEDEDDLNLDRLCVAIQASVTSLFQQARDRQSGFEE
jgi:predicted membrane chloride channel (bestrophin family)